jgi:dihydrofolate reductase
LWNGCACLQISELNLNSAVTKTIASITMSLDGFIAGRNISEALPMGEDGILLHRWIFDQHTEVDKKILSDLVENSDAVILGSRTYNTAINVAWEGQSPFDVPAFVLINADPVVEKPGFTFVREGLQSALMQAQNVARGRNIWIMGGASVIQQFIRENLLDELHVHIAPILLGKGTSLFSTSGSPGLRLLRFNTIDTKGATHLFYEIVK